MYKSFKINNDWSIAFERFNKFCKSQTITDVFKNGIRNFDNMDHYTYSIVIGRFRVMIYKNKHTAHCSN